MKAVIILLIALSATDLAMTVVNMLRTDSLITKFTTVALSDTKEYIGACQQGELNILRGIQNDIDGLSKSIRHINNKLDPPQSKIVIREASRGDVVDVTSQVVIPTEIKDVPGDEVMSLLAEDIAAQIAPMMDVRTDYDLLHGENITRARIRVLKGDTHENSRRD